VDVSGFGFVNSMLTKCVFDGNFTSPSTQVINSNLILCEAPPRLVRLSIFFSLLFLLFLLLFLLFLLLFLLFLLLFLLFLLLFLFNAMVQLPILPNPGFVWNWTN